MIGKKVSHYKILEEIGSGGMGIVYKAEDFKLNRTVALKFVVPRIVRREEDRTRFVREAQTAASLNHPNICTIYEIDEEDENLFIAMEYVEGQSLKDIIEKGPLKIESALDKAIQIADGLKEAHDAGVVHRDIKSSNILITKKGQAKIMDFGLARPVKDSKLTETATIMGTVAYMSPEQASGESYDHRTDIWSFGVVLYEMLSGQLPFGGEHQQLILYSILNQNPQPMKNLLYTLPLELERIIHRCLEKEPSERYQRADELLEDLRRLKRETETGIVLPRKKITEKTRRVPSMTISTIVIVLFVAVVLFTGYILFDWFKSPVEWRTSIAVLPIENLSTEDGNEPLCRSTTRNIIFKLARFSPELRVVPYDSVRKYKDSKKGSVEIGQELSVEYVLVSSFDSSEEWIRIDAELIDVETNTNRLPISGKFEIKDLFNIEDEISKKIVGELDLHFTESELIAAKKREPKSIEAYNWYVKGMDIIDKPEAYSNIDLWFSEAIEMFEKAISMDPNYALAYWGLGAAHEHYYVETDKREDLELTIDYFEKAYDLNPDLAEANVGLGWAYFYKEDLSEAAKSFKRALELEKNSKSALVTCDVGVFLSSVGLFHRAIKYLDKSIQLEPSYLRAYEHLASCYWYIGEFEEGAEVAEKALELEKNYPKLYLLSARQLILLGKYTEAEKVIAEAEKIDPDSARVQRHIAFMWAAKGEKEKALHYIEGGDESYGYPLTCIYSLLGMKDEAIENMKLGIEKGFEEVQNYLYPYLFLKENSCHRNLFDDPRFEDILKKQREQYVQREKILKDFL
jgi:serine/threonine protein kinase/tetratricopeptide (TPR) repeat protein